MSQPTHSHDHLPPRPTLSIDWEVYAAMLEESHMPLEQQKELIETLWSIAVMFIDIGLDLHPMSQICGEPDDPLSDDPPDLLYLLEQDIITHTRHEEAPWTDQ